MPAPDDVYPEASLHSRRSEHNRVAKDPLRASSHSPMRAPKAYPERCAERLPDIVVPVRRLADKGAPAHQSRIGDGIGMSSQRGLPEGKYDPAANIKTGLHGTVGGILHKNVIYRAV